MKVCRGPNWILECTLRNRIPKCGIHIPQWGLGAGECIFPILDLPLKKNILTKAPLGSVCVCAPPCASLLMGECILFNEWGLTDVTGKAEVGERTCWLWGRKGGVSGDGGGIVVVGKEGGETHSILVESVPAKRLA